MISIFVSGKESLKFLKGLLQIISPEEIPLNVIVDTTSHFDFYDIRIYPQLTNVFLLFMNQLNENKWTGKGEDELEISAFLKKMDDEFPSIKEPYEVGDLFLAPNIFINYYQKNNRQLSACIDEISKNITEAAILLLSNDVPEIELSSKELSVDKESNEQKISTTSLFEIFESATLSREAKNALLKSEIIILPKLPISSMLAFLKIQHFQEVLKETVGQIIFISPITDKELDPVSLQAFQAAGLTPSSVGLSKALHGLVDVYILDTIEESIKPRITRLGMQVVSCPLNLDKPKKRLHLVEFVLKMTPFRDLVESFGYKAEKEVDALKQGLRSLFGGFKRLTSRPSSRKENYKKDV